MPRRWTKRALRRIFYTLLTTADRDIRAALFSQMRLLRKLALQKRGERMKPLLCAIPLFIFLQSAEAAGIAFLDYHNRMLSLIRERWAWAGSRQDLAVSVRFGIQENGEIIGLKIVSQSGDPSFDDSVLRAVSNANPLPPPPASYRKDFMDVELTFRPKDLEVFKEPAPKKSAPRRAPARPPQKPKPELSPGQQKT